MMKRKLKTFYLMISPWIVMFFFLNVFPMVYSFFLSLTQFDGITSPDFVGFKNYFQLMDDYRFLQSIIATLKFTFFNVFFSLIISFFMANLLNCDITGKGFFRSVFFIPYAIPVVATVYVWKTLFNRETGLINFILELIAPGRSLNFLVDFPSASLILMFVWQSGGAMVVFLAGLQNIPKQLIEAADLDGANNFFKLKNIVLPLLSPIILYQIVVGIMLSFNVIVQPMLLTSSPGGAFNAFLSQQPAAKNYFTIIYAFQLCFTNQSFGYGMAVIWAMFIIMVLLTLSFMKIMNRVVYYEYK